MQKACFFKSGGSTRAPRKGPRAAELHETVVVACADANEGSDAVVVLCPQNVRFCYCMRALLVNVFFAFAAKLHFVCIFTVYPVPPSWLHGVLLSSDGVKMQILCLPFAYFC